LECIIYVVLIRIHFKRIIVINNFWHSPTVSIDVTLGCSHEMCQCTQLTVLFSFKLYSSIEVYIYLLPDMCCTDLPFHIPHCVSHIHKTETCFHKHLSLLVSFVSAGFIACYLAGKLHIFSSIGRGKS
jgi:hypothetical protein